MSQKFDFNASRRPSYKTEACPVSFQQVDKHLIKAYSSIILFVLVWTLITGNYIGMYLISLDFLIRVLAGIKYSPLCNILTRLMKITPLKPLLVNAGSKKIAAQVGLFFCVAICSFHFLGWHLLAQLFILMFIAAIALDLLFDYCLACKLQSLYLTYWKK